MITRRTKVQLLIFVLITLIGMQRVGFIDSTLTSISEGATVRQRHAINFRGSVHDRAISIRDAVLVADKDLAKKHQDDIVRLNEFYQKAASTLDGMYIKVKHSAEEENLLRLIKEVETSTLAVTENLVGMINEGRQQEARQGCLQGRHPQEPGRQQEVGHLQEGRLPLR